MNRRSLLAGSAGLFAAPAIAQQGSVVRFVPQADVGVLDPTFTTAYVTRNHAFLVYDTLYGTNDGFEVSPQMVAGHVMEDDGRRWKLTLREGLKFHDGTPVLARDVVASLQRWWRRDAFGQELRAVTDELSALDDRTVQFRLKRPFGLLPAALGKPSSYMPAIMPERLANGPADRQVSEIIGSGPFRFNRGEYVGGSRLVYDKFDGYVPRAEGTPSRTAGPKRVFIDRVEWMVIPDPATAAGALGNGEVDWLEKPLVDLLPSLRRNRNVALSRTDQDGSLPIMRFNQLQAPFNNPAIRQVVLRAVEQSDFLTAVAGEDRSHWRDKVGIFTPGTPLANDAGMEAVTSPRDLARSARDLAAAGYKGERIVVMGAGDYPQLNALAIVGADLLRRIGFNVDLQTVDWGTVVQRRLKKDPVDQGGWSIYFTNIAGLEAYNPASHQNTRGLGERSNPGWPTSPRLEALRTEWFAATDLATEQRVAREMQAQAMIDVPYVPLGQYFEETAYRRNLSGILGGFPLFHNVRKG
ncbi:ABC transporter substrate-binding protein [Rhodovarius crocodyli]|uniref:ABC transporter substrate-binding protein n=1 Tax=Rhodovarius crocodyli TaxID=1979269 RepID=A0A437MJ92_9PROT|nr:ABC transporter substrate-binding protein [Rhodovarius crocodyli]RVT97747.1 ABC transporter substrate-binding protein [Rhodovarius crocodyli]